MGNVLKLPQPLASLASLLLCSIVRFLYVYRTSGCYLNGYLKSVASYQQNSRVSENSAKGINIECVVIFSFNRFK